MLRILGGVKQRGQYLVDGIQAQSQGQVADRTNVSKDAAMPCVDIGSSVGRGLIPRQVTPQEDVSRSLDRTSQVGPPAARAPSWWPGRRPRCQRRHAGSSGLHRNSETGTDPRSGRLLSTGPGLPKNDHELVSLLQRGLDVVTQAVAQGQEELQEIKLRPDMIMNAVVLLHQRPGLLSNRTLPLYLIDEAHPVLKMLHPRLSRTDLMVLVEVGGRRDGPIPVEGETLVGNGQVEYSPGLQNAEMVRQRTDGILAVLDEVIGDDEIF